MNVSRIILCVMAIFFVSCNSVVLFTKTHQTPNLKQARRLLQSMERVDNIWNDLRDASDSSFKKGMPWRYEISAKEAAQHRANFRRLYTLIETQRRVFDYPGLITFGKARWQPSDHRYQFRIGVPDDKMAISERDVISEFYLYTNVNGVIVEKKPVISNW